MMTVEQLMGIMFGDVYAYILDGKDGVFNCVNRFNGLVKDFHDEQIGKAEIVRMTPIGDMKVLITIDTQTPERMRKHESK